MIYPWLFLVLVGFAALNNESVARFMLAASLEPFGELTPRANRMMPATTAFALTLTTSHGVIDRVHHHTANVRPASEPTGSSSLAARNVHVIRVPYQPDSCVGVLVDLPNFTGRQTHQCVTGFAVIEHYLLTRAPRNLATSARDNLQVVNHGSQRDCL